MMCTSIRFCLSAAVAGVTALTARIGFAGDAHDAVSLEFPVETEAVILATAALFDRVEAGGEVPVRKRPVIRMPRLAQKASVVSEGGPEPLTINGPLRHLTGYRIDWYPTDRFLGSVDFMGTWDGNRNLVCGYLTWDVSDPANPVLETVVANYVDIGALQRGTTAQIHQALLEANCAHGTVAANYAFFDPAG